MFRYITLIQRMRVVAYRNRLAFNITLESSMDQILILKNRVLMLIWSLCYTSNVTFKTIKYNLTIDFLRKLVTHGRRVSII